MEAMLTYWLTSLIFPSELEDKHNGYVFPLAVILVKGKKVALAPICLGPLYARGDKCVANVA